MQSPAKKSKTFIPAPKVFGERYKVSQMTGWRWEQDEALNFPRPVYIGRYKYLDESELEEWERTLPRGRTLATSRATEAGA